VLLLAGCIHAPNLKIKDVTILSRGEAELRYSVAVKNAKRWWIFSRCRTGPARGEVKLEGTLSARRSRGSAPAGSQALVSQIDRAVRDELPAGKTAHELVDVEIEADITSHAFLVVELASPDVEGRCSVLHGRKAVRIPRDDD
jgi:hypothetical protein